MEFRRIQKFRQVDEIFGERGCIDTPKNHCKKPLQKSFAKNLCKKPLQNPGLLKFRQIDEKLIQTEKTGVALKISQKKSI